MKKILLSLAIVAFTISAALAQNFNKTYNFGNITGISASYVYNVKITKGNSDKIEVIGPNYLREYLNIYSSGGTLYLKMDLPRNYKHPKNSDQEITVHLQMKTIKYIDLSGASSLTSTGEFSTDNLTFDLSGASKVKEMQISGESVKLDCSGASSLNFAGKFNKMTLDCSGASKMTINGNINYISGDISGATNINYNGTSTQIDLGLSGASKVILKGKANTVRLGCSGASYINTQDMIAQDVDVTASGASKANVYVTNILKADATASSIINYYGSPKQVISKPTNIRKAD